MSSQGDRDRKALNEVKSYLEQTGRKAPESLLTRSKKTYEVLAKLVVSKVQAPAKPNAQSYIRSAAEAPLAAQVGIEKPSTAPAVVLFLCGIVGLAVLVGIILVIQRYAESRSDYKLAVQAMHSDNAQLAVQELDAACRLGYRSPEVFLLRASAHASLGQYAGARDDFSSVLSSNPQNTDALVGRADASLHMHDYERAATDCDAILKLKPDLASALAMRAVAFAHSDKFADSLRDCMQFFQVSKDEKARIDIQATRALVNFKLGRPADAMKDLDAVLAAGQAKPGLRLLRAQCDLALEKTADAVDDLTAELKLDPNSVEALKLRANAYLKLNKQKEALTDLNAVLEQAPSAQLYITRAGIYTDLKEYEPAVDDYDRSMTMKPPTAELKAKRAEAWELLKKYKPMVATIKENIANAAGAASSVPQLQQGADALTARGYKLYRAGKLDDAIDALSAAVRANPSSGDARRYLAYACMSAGNCVDASTEFQALMGMNQLNESDQMQYARALTALGRTEEAIEMLKDIVADNPTNSWARLSLIKLYMDAGATVKAMRLSQEGMSNATSDSERAAYNNLLRSTASDTSR